jgi:hypothetical protein
VCSATNCTELLANMSHHDLRAQCGFCEGESHGCDGRDAGFPEAPWIFPTNVAATAFLSFLFPFMGILGDK